MHYKVAIICAAMMLSANAYAAWPFPAKNKAPKTQPRIATQTTIQANPPVPQPNKHFAPDALILQMAQNERAIIKDISSKAPIVETYLQIMSPGGEVAVNDRYFVSRIRLGKGLLDDVYLEPREVMADIHPKRKNVLQVAEEMAAHTAEHTVEHRPLTYDTRGFMELLGPNVHGFNPSKYRFHYLGTEFLGDINTHVYNVEPKHKGQFNGRFWIEPNGHLVRFTGVFQKGASESAAHPHYVHFDSWRENVQPGEWLPSAIYIEEPMKTGAIHGQVRLWGYSLASKESVAGDHVSVSVENAVDHTDTGNVDPLTAMHEWSKMASANILERLERTGLVSPQGSFDSVLDQIATNIIVPNDLQFSQTVHCRVLLTTPLEAFAIGNTIVLSKGLIDTLPNEESIASVVAFELAHLTLHGGNTDTRYSFPDRTMFPDTTVLRKMPLGHTEEENVRAADLAYNYLLKSMYAEKMGNVGLYYRQMDLAGDKLKNLYHPQVGDSMIAPSGRPWLLSKMLSTAPHLEQDNITQIPALPLGSNLILDPWTSQVSLNMAPRTAPRSGYEKRPFEVMPVFFRLKVAEGNTVAVEQSHVASPVAGAGGVE